VLVLCVAAVASAYVVSGRMLAKRYDVPESTIVIPTDSASIARGSHIASSISSCYLCHGSDGAGKLYMADAAIGTMAGPNLTRGRGGIASQRTDADWVRAIRHGVRRDSTSLILMPSEVFTHLSDEDLGAVIAYFKSLPPVDREIPRTHFGPVGRALLAAGKMNLLVASKTVHQTTVSAVPRAVSVEYGRYLADIGGCRGCHGLGLSGGRVAGPPGLPPASNLTPSGPVAQWSVAQFGRAVREGLRPNGAPINEFMPWKTFAGMSNAEVEALWLYIGHVPPKAFGGK
jgi:mono/diheme cytochrome c family protein